MEDKPVNLMDTFDAQIWVSEWMKTIKNKPSIPNDEGAMLAWFAGAIMAGHDYARRRYEKVGEHEIVSEQAEKEAKK